MHTVSVSRMSASRSIQPVRESLIGHGRVSTVRMPSHVSPPDRTRSSSLRCNSTRSVEHSVACALGDPIRCHAQHCQPPADRSGDSGTSLPDRCPDSLLITSGEIDLLAVPRTPPGIAQLAPGVTDAAPTAGQLAISGGFAFDNSFRMNGVDVADNLFAVPFNLFIEDAIERTDVLTAGIPVEFGRFTGGVVNAVTKSGTNSFHGSWRGNLASPSWSTMTPLERCVAPGRITPPGCMPAAPRPNDPHMTHEATLGGPIVRDQLWFFAAARSAGVTHTGSLPRTNLQNTQTDLNRRIRRQSIRCLDGRPPG